MAFERYSQALLPKSMFFLRVARHLLAAIAIVAGALGIGILGYHYICDLLWIDALLNASMILTGMGPVDKTITVSAKVFASLYALFSGVIFLTVISVALAPILHRVLHKFHLDEVIDDEISSLH